MVKTKMQIMRFVEKINYWRFYIIDVIVTWLWNGFSNKQFHSCVLMYHDITYDDVNPVQSCLHSVGDFLRTLEKFEKEGYEFVSIDKAIAPPPVGHKYVTVTFDDVYDSVFTIAYPILRRKNIPFILFVSPGLLGSKPYYMTEIHLEQIATDALCTLGAHSMNHPMLRKIKDSYSEIYQSKAWLEHRFGKKIDYCAYPYGKHCAVSMHVMKQAKAIGFKCAFGTIDAPINRFSSLFRFYLPRMVVHQ